MIKVEHLSKSFGPKKAVNDITFSVERGEVLGFLGPNGAGKSTTMRMITGFISPTAGKITVGGLDVMEDPIPPRRLMGYLPENAPSYTDMTVQGFLSFCAELRGLIGEDGKRAVSRVVELCFLETVLHQTIDTLSKGYRHRTCLAQSILHDPDVLILDEPTDGLDPNQKHEMRQLIKRMGEKKAIIFSTHILEEVDAVCTRAIIIDRGRVVANGTPAELRARSEVAGAVTLGVAEISADVMKGRLASLPQTREIILISSNDGRVVVRVLPKGPSGKDLLATSVAELAQREGWKVRELHLEEGRLDEVFRSITWSETSSEQVSTGQKTSSKEGA